MHGPRENARSVHPLYQTVRFVSNSKTHSRVFAYAFVTFSSITFYRKIHVSPIPKLSYSNSLILAFHTKTQVSSQNFSKPKLIIKNKNLSNLSQHNIINSSPQINKNHNSPFMTHFYKTHQINNNLTITSQIAIPKA